jgi:hypothetical protein
MPCKTGTVDLRHLPRKTHIYWALTKRHSGLTPLMAPDPQYHFGTTDSPGFTGSTSSDVTYYLEFKAIITDTTTGIPVAEKDGYWIKISGKQYPRKLEHGKMD